MKRRGLIMLAVSVSGMVFSQADWITRNGGSLGGGKESAAKRASLATSENPIKKTITEEQFVKNILPNLSGKCMASADGAVCQYYRFSHSIQGRLEESEDTIGTREIKIVQTLKPGLYLAQNKSLSTDMFALELEGRQVADGSVLHLKPKPTDRIYSYTSVMGASKNIAIFHCDPIPKIATDDQIVSAFKKGQSFFALLPAPFPCDTCKGTGFVKSKNSTFTLRKKCDSCGGSSTVLLPAVNRVSIR